MVQLSMRRLPLKVGVPAGADASRTASTGAASTGAGRVARAGAFPGAGFLIFRVSTALTVALVALVVDPSLRC